MSGQEMSEREMSEREKKEQFLNEHLKYEHDMLEYSLSKLYCEGDQLGWNAFFESFAIHARNLYDFLRNEGKSNNYRASDFAENYKKPDHNIEFNKLDPSVFHLGKDRVRRKIKVRMNNIEILAGWIDENHLTWHRQLKKEYKDKVRERLKCKGYKYYNGVSVNTACTSPSFSMVNNETAQEITNFRIIND